MRSNKHLIFKPSGYTWRLGKYDQTIILSKVITPGGSENGTKKAFDVSPGNECNLESISNNTKTNIEYISRSLINCMTFAPFTAENFVPLFCAILPAI